MVNVNRSIDMIVQHSNTGKLKLIKFRINENDEEQTYAIKSYLLIETSTLSRDDNLLKYRCKYIVGDTEKSCEIHYYKNRLKWVFYRTE